MSSSTENPASPALVFPAAHEGSGLTVARVMSAHAPRPVAARHYAESFGWPARQPVALRSRHGRQPGFGRSPRWLAKVAAPDASALFLATWWRDGEQQTASVMWFK